MRKLVAAELVIFATTLSVSDPAPANEFISNMPTVSVTGHYNSRTRFTFDTHEAIVPWLPPNAFANYTDLEAGRVFHALHCAKAYGQPGYKGPNAIYKTWITDRYGWRSNGNPPSVKTTVSRVAPEGYSRIINGATWRGSDKTTYIFKRNIPTVAELIKTIAHEYAHQHGAEDLHNGAPNDAVAIGEATRNAYLADRGARCGGGGDSFNPEQPLAKKLAAIDRPDTLHYERRDPNNRSYIYHYTRPVLLGRWWRTWGGLYAGKWKNELSRSVLVSWVPLNEN